MMDIDEEVRTNTKATFSYGLLHIDTPVLADQQKLKFTSMCGHWI